MFSNTVLGSVALLVRRELHAAKRERFSVRANVLIISVFARPGTPF